MIVARDLLSGNEMVAHAVRAARVEVVSAYPITPQTTIIEKLADMVAQGSLRAEFLKVESEHSAMAGCIGAAMTGVRTFTATSSQGLALMHEMLHWAAYGRLPVVMVNVNRGLAPPWTIFTDQTDSLAQRDTGWMQLYCADNQEVFDTIIQAYAIAEAVQLPAMVILDAFVLSHTSEVVDLRDQDLVDRFLPKRSAPFKLDVDDPAAFGGLVVPELYQEMRHKIEVDMDRALGLASEKDREWGAMFGQSYGLVDAYRCEDAEVVLVTSGTPSSTARLLVDRLREQGRAVGRLKVRLFRPFPTEEIRRCLSRVPKVAVLDRGCSYGSGGVFFGEIKAALYNLPASERPALYGYIGGLAGRDLTMATMEEAIAKTFERSGPEPETVWIGHRP